MTIASLIVDVAANTVKLQKDVEKINGSLDGIQKVAGNVGKAMAAAFTITAIASAAKEVIDYAGKVSDLSARLGVSTRTVQEWENAFAPAGIAVESVAAASEQLTAKLIGGDKSAVSALQKMGLSIEDLRRMKPEERFTAVADAVGRLQDQGEKVYASKTLFGKAGPELLAGLNGNLGDTIKQLDGMGIILSAETIAAAEKFGDQLGALGKQGMALIATVLGPILPLLIQLANILMYLGANVIGPVVNIAVKGLMTLLAELWAQLAGLLGRLAELGSKLPGVGGQFAALGEWLKTSAAGAETYIGKLWTKTEEGGATVDAVKPKLLGLGDALKVVDKAAEAAAKKQADWLTSVDETTQKLGLSVFNLSRFGAVTMPAATSAIGDNRDELLEWKPAIEGVTTEVLDWAEAHEKATGILREQMGLLVQMPKRVKTAAEAFRESQSGGGIGGFFKKGLGDLFGGADSLKGGIKNILGGIGTGITEGLGNIVSGGISSLVSAGMGLLTKGLGKVWGKLTNSEGKQVNDMRDAFQGTFGTFDDMAKKAAGAGYEIKKLLDTKKVKDFEREMRAMNEAIAFQESAMRTLDETVQKYGFSIDELGPALSRQRLDEKAQELWKDFQVLTSAGIDVDTVLGKMGGSINEFVGQALRTGTEIPAAMAPMLQRMVEMGTLTDANGNVITNLEDAGVRFSMTMSEGFQALIGEVKKLTDAIGRGLGTAINNTPALNIPVNFIANPDMPLPDVPAMAAGGIVRRPTLALIGEAGPEAVVPLSQYRNRASGDVYVEVVNVVDGREVSRSVTRQQSRDMRTRRKLAAA